MSYYGDDDYDYRRDRGRRRPSPHRLRTDRPPRDMFLDPNANNAGLYRTRSVGHAPAPNVYVYNDIIQDSNQSQRSNSRSPPGMLVPYPPSPRYGRRESDALAEGIMDLALDNQRLRSRSRGRSDAGARRDYYEQQYYDLERQRSYEQERERIRQEYEIKALRDEEKRKVGEAREKEERKRIIAEHDLKVREEEEDRKREEQALRDKIEREKKEAKEKEEREYNEFLLKQKQKKEEEDRKKKEEEEHLQNEMRKRLARFGYTGAQIEAMVKEESDKKNDTRTLTTTTQITRWGESSNPVYPKIHVKYLSVDTLRYYELPWEYDSVSKPHPITPNTSNPMLIYVFV